MPTCSTHKHKHTHTHTRTHIRPNIYTHICIHIYKPCISYVRVMTPNQSVSYKLHFLLPNLWRPGPWFDIKKSSYQYRKSHYGDKTILPPSYLHIRISYTDKTTYLYWIRAQDIFPIIIGSDLVTNTRLASCLTQCCTHTGWNVLLSDSSTSQSSWGTLLVSSQFDMYIVLAHFVYAETWKNDKTYTIQMV